MKSPRILTFATMVAAVTTSICLAAGETFPFYLPWDDDTNSVTSLSSLLPSPAGQNGYVHLDTDGHLATDAGRIRLWGVNTCFGANFPTHADADKIARRMAKYGINSVRFHHMDMSASPDGIWQSTNPDRVLSSGQLDKLDYFINQLKQNGIYADLNLLVSRPLNQGTELNSDINLISDWKVRAAVGFFDPAILDLQKRYATDLLSHTNAYTGKAYTNEPAVCFIEINNENGLVQAFLGGQLDTLPTYYKEELNARWNAWLVARYTNHAALVSGWNAQTNATGAELLANWSFTNGISSWNLEQYDTALVTASVANDGPSGSNAVKLAITATGSAGWHVQFSQAGLQVQSNTSYTLSFWTRCDPPRSFDAGLSMAHDPWQYLGFSVSLNASAVWERHEYTFMPSATDSNARVIFSNLGLQTGNVWFAGVSMKPGGSMGLYPEENLASNNIRSFVSTSEPERTTSSRRDWFRFLLQTEENYWKTMRDHVKITLGSQSLIFGTIIGCSTPNLMANFDVVDTHSYWQHPSFPGIPWDSVDWYVKNSAMVNDPRGSTLAGLSMKRVLGKAHALTEYNHPNPNTYQAETFFELAAYASLQDWDALFPFAYSHRRDNWDTRCAPNHFDVDQVVVKMASMVPAALAFRRGDIAPASQQIVAPLGHDTELEKLLTAWAWGLVDATSLGEDSRAGLIHRVAIATEGAVIPPGALTPGTTPVSMNTYTSDTSQIKWDVSTSSRGVLTVESPKSVFVVGFGNGRTFDLSGFRITPGSTLQNGFAGIALTAMNGSSLQSATNIVLTAVGAQQNANVTWYQYPSTVVQFPPAEGINVTLKNNWGTATSLVEGVNAIIDLPFGPTNITVWALDNRGQRKQSLPVATNSGKAQITIGPNNTSVWYEISINTQVIKTSHGVPYTWLNSKGITNNYEQADASDPDNDGMVTWKEYWAGTEPGVKSSVFRCQNIDSNGVHVTFYASTNSGVTNPIRMCRSTNLLLGNWQVVGNDIIRSANGTNSWLDTNPSAATTVFYRPAIATTSP